MSNEDHSSIPSYILDTIEKLKLQKLEDSYRSLKSAIDRNDVFIVNLVLQNCIKLENFKEVTRTLIHYAIEKKKYKLIELIFVFMYICDTDINFTYKNGLNHFHAACIIESFKLLSHYISMHNCTDKNGLSYFHAACIIENLKLVSHYISMGVDINLPFKPVTHDDCNNFTPLHFAVFYAKVEMVKLLLENGADINATDSFNRTPLHLACCIAETDGESFALFDERTLNYQNNMLQIISLLIEGKSDINARDRIGNTPIYYIFHDGHPPKNFAFNIDYTDLIIKKLKIVKELRIQQKYKLEHLLANGANVTTRNDVNDTILHQAVKYLISSRQLDELSEIYFDDLVIAEMITLIIKHGTDVNAINHMNQTPLQIAISVLSAQVFNVLIQHNADVNSIKFDYQDNNYFCYPNVIPCFEATENLLYIINILESKGYNFSLLDNLAILKFFIIYDIDCDCASTANKNDILKLKNYIEFGTEIRNIIKKCVPIMCDDNYQVDFIRLVAYHHLKILEYINKIIGLNVDIKKHIDDSRIEQKNHSFFFFQEEGDEAHERYLCKLQDEYIKMQDTKLNNNMSLKEILSNYSNNVKFHLCFIDTNYREILQSDEFRLDYPNFGGTIKGYFTKSLVRRYFVKSASDYIRMLINICLPDYCCERISHYLSNEDLWNLCLSAISSKIDYNTSTNLSNDIQDLNI